MGGCVPERNNNNDTLNQPQSEINLKNRNLIVIFSEIEKRRW
jgi:hypothetical protein